MRTVTVFAEHAPSEAELASLLATLRSSGSSPMKVHVIMPLHSSRTPALMDEIAAARGWSARSAVEDMHTNRPRWVDTDLHHLVTSLRKAGHSAHGEYASGGSVRKTLAAIHEDHAETVLLLTYRHRASHLLRCDLEHRIRRAGPAQIVSIPPSGR